VAAGSLDDSLIGLFAKCTVISGCLDFRLLHANYMNIGKYFI